MLVVLCVVAVSLLAGLLAWDTWKFRSIPPGPKGLPVIGLLPSQMKLPALHLSYTELCKKYGGLVSLKMGNALTVVVGSKAGLRDVLFSKGTTFGKRPYRRSYYIRSKGQTGIGFCSYGPEWKERRKVLHQTFFKGAVVNELFQNRINKSVNELLASLFAAAESGEGMDLRTPFRLETSNVVMAVLNGTHLEADDQEFEMRKQFASLNGVLQGSFSIGDYFPQLSRFSDDEEAFARFQELTNIEMKRHADSIEVHRRRLVEKEGATDDDEKSTDLQDILLRLQEQEMVEKGRNRLFNADALQVICSEMLAGGTDTQAATMEWFILALCNYPEVQQRVQEEVDSVLQGAPPTGEDRKRLPYLSCIISEVHRRWTILPLALPHSTDVDVVVQGHRIPANTTVVINQWALNHDPEVWPEPSNFDPDRFAGISKKEIDNVMLAFGRGVRVCPGRPLAEIQLCTVLATIIQRFEVSAVLEEGQSKLDEEGEPGLIFFPKPYLAKFARRKTIYPTPDFLPVG